MQLQLGGDADEPPAGDEVEITGVTAQAPGNSYMPDGYVGPWAYLRNVFNPGGLVDGVGYTLEQWRSASSSWPEKFRFAWEFPNSNPAPAQFCWGYPALIWGAGPHGYAWGTSGHGAPMRASDISTFTIGVDLAFSGANGADILIDVYVLKGADSPVFDGDYHNEISILLSHNGVGPIEWLTTEATATHTFAAPLGDCAIYKQPTSEQIMIMPRTGSLRRDVMTGLIDAGEVIDHLIGIGLVEPNGWVTGFEIGVETQRPNAWNSAPYSGDLRFNQAPVVTWSAHSYPLRVGQQAAVSGAASSAITGVPGGTWGSNVNNQYSCLDVWNADGTLMALLNQGGGTPSVVFLHGRTFVPQNLPSFPSANEFRWHPTDPDRAILAGGGSVTSLNVRTGAQSTIATVPGSGDLTFGGYTGNISDDGRWVIVSRGHNPVTACWLLDLTTGATTSLGYVSDFVALDYATVSPLGTYVLMNGETGAGIDRTRIYNRATGALVQNWTESGRPSHADLTVNEAGEEIVVGVSQVGGGYSNPEDGRIIVRRMSDGAVTRLTEYGYGLHASSRNRFARSAGFVASFGDLGSPWSHPRAAMLVSVRSPGASRVAVPDLGEPINAEPAISPDGRHVVWAQGGKAMVRRIL